MVFAKIKKASRSYTINISSMFSGRLSSQYIVIRNVISCSQPSVLYEMWRYWSRNIAILVLPTFFYGQQLIPDIIGWCLDCTKKENEFYYYYKILCLHIRLQRYISHLPTPWQPNSLIDIPSAWTYVYSLPNFQILTRVH